MLPIVLLLAVTAGAQVSVTNIQYTYTCKRQTCKYSKCICVFILILQLSSATDQARCEKIFDGVRDVLTNPNTWIVSAGHAKSRVDDVVTNAIHQVASEKFPDVLKTKRRIEKAIDDKSEGSAIAKDRIKTIVREGLLAADDLYNNVILTISQSYNDAIIVFASNATHNPDDLKNLMLLPLHVIKTDFMVHCQEGLANGETAVEAIKNEVRRIQATMNVDPKHIQNAPIDFTPIKTPYLLDGLAMGYVDLHEKQQVTSYTSFVATNTTAVMTMIVEGATDILANVNQTMITFLQQTTIAPPNVTTPLIEKVKSRVLSAESDMAQWNVRAQADINSAFPQKYDGMNPPPFVLASSAQETVNGLTKKINTVMTAAIMELGNMYEFLMGIAL